MKKKLALLLSAMMIVGGCIIPTLAVTVHTETPAQSMEEDDRHNEFISYYYVDPPAGTSSRDYSLLEGSVSGNLKWDRMAVEITKSMFEDIMEDQFETVFGPVGSDLSSAVMDAIVGDVKSALDEYAPESGDLDYVCRTYINEDYSTNTSRYYKHVVTYTLASGDKVPVTFYETQTWI